jgi:hypothetical protein
MRRQLLPLSTVLLFFFLSLFVPASVESRTWYVRVDGTGDAPTIQAAVDSAQDADEVLVAAGTYTWTNQSPNNDSNTMIDVAVEIWLHSESGPEATILDAEGEGRVMYIHNYDARIQPVIEGFTLQHGSADLMDNGAGILTGYCDPVIANNIIVDNWTFYYGGALFFGESNAIVEGNLFARNTVVDRGGAILSWTNCQLTIRNNVFDDNLAGQDGAAIYCFQSTGTIEDNVITRNTAGDNGGGIFCWGSSPAINNNLIAWNRASGECGGGIYCRDSAPEIEGNTLFSNRSSCGASVYLEDSSPAISSNIIAGSQDGVAVYCDTTSTPSITCNDFWDNEGGDSNCPLGDDNFSADPMFCDEASEDFSLHEGSPCAPANSPAGCGLVGALPVGCWDTPISERALLILAAALLAVAIWAIRRRRYQAQ